MKLSLDERFKRIEEYLIGIWRFRRRGKPCGWCGTYCVNGDYYDIYPSKSIEIALDKIYRNVKTINQNRGGK